MAYMLTQCMLTRVGVFAVSLIRQFLLLLYIKVKARR